jgi:hypothetical protein
MKERVDFLEESLRLMPITDNGLTTTAYDDPPVSLLRTNLILPGIAAPVNPLSVTSSATCFFAEDCGVLTIWTN